MTRTARIVRWFRPAPVVLLLAPLLMLVPVLDGGQGKSAGERSPKKANRETSQPVAVEVRFTDDSVLKLTLRDKALRLNTRYGKLLVPVADIRYIDFATRIPDSIARRVDAAVANLGNTQYRVRQAANAELLELRESAYPALLRATRHKDPEVVRRAEALIKQLREQVPLDQLTFRKDDVVRTPASRISGQIEGEALKAHTYQFGEVQLKPGHMRSLQYTGIAPDPGNLEGLRDLVGKSFRFQVKGAVDGSVWGAGVYTTDSALATAAVHADGRTDRRGPRYHRGAAGRFWRYGAIRGYQRAIRCFWGRLRGQPVRNGFKKGCRNLGERGVSTP
jgi:hypothetical protein